MEKPFVSIIMPTYNRERLLSRAIKSVLDQTYPAWELIIIDDNSTDNTKKMISDLYGTNPQIRYLQNTKSKGVSGARNTGILQAKGEYISFLDSDDQWSEHHLEDSLYVFNHENVNFTFSYWYEKTGDTLFTIFDSQENQKNFDFLRKNTRVDINEKYFVFYEDHYEFTTAVKDYYCYHLNTMVIKTAFLLKFKLFNEKMKSCEDSDLIFRILMGNRFALIPHYNYIYSMGEDNLYFFINRNTLELNEILKNKDLITKLTSNGKWQLKLRQMQINNIQKSNCIKNKKACIKPLRKFISRKAFTLAFLNQRYNKIVSIYYYIYSFFLYFDKKRFFFFINFICPLLYRNLELNRYSLDIH